MNSLPLLAQLARVLGIEDVSELTGGEYSAPVPAWGRDVHHVVPAVRRALTESSFEMPGDVVPPALTGQELGLRVRRLWELWHRSPRQRSDIGIFMLAMSAS
ncbi:MAG: hypothetical protein ACRDQ0_04535 [Pseudonocardia sp.]